MTLSRFHRQPMVHREASKVLPWQGSPPSSPWTGTVHADFESASEPKKYWVPSIVVIFQDSPLPGVPRRSIVEPLSLLVCHTPVAVSLISMPPPPANDAVALSLRQHRS